MMLIRRRFAAALGLFCLIAATGGCSDGAAERKPPAAEAADMAKRWTAFRDAFIAQRLRFNPLLAVADGQHHFDGQLPDWGEEALRTRAAFYQRAVRQARAFRDTALTPEQRFERDYLIAIARAKLFWLVDADQPHRNPAFYVDNGLDPAVYVSRPYAAPEVRMRAFIAYLRAIPRAAGQIGANLAEPMPASFVDYGVSSFRGFARFYESDARAAFAAVKDAALWRDFDAAVVPAAAAMRDLAGRIESGRATATQDYALGPERFARMLAATEMVDTPLDALERIGEADLRRNQAALKAACDRLAPGLAPAECVKRQARDKPADVLAAARRQLPGLRAFIVRRDLVSIPGAEEATVAESPPYNRENGAYIDTPGRHDRGVPAMYYIAPPDPRWPAAMRAAYIPTEPDLLFTSVHEVWPGHFLQSLHARRAKSPLGQLFVGYAFSEGWAHYAEEMMWDAGLGDGDPAIHVGQLSNALLRNCRFLAAIRLHARGMTIEQARRLFVDQCYQDEGNALQQAVRGTYDPAYLNYTLGKLMIRRLRDDWMRGKTDPRALKAFHDRLLSYGGPPIPLIRREMLGGEAKAVF
jgi:uncharacterized protein (DUF885 family)